MHLGERATQKDGEPLKQIDEEWNPIKQRRDLHMDGKKRVSAAPAAHSRSDRTWMGGNAWVPLQQPTLATTRTWMGGNEWVLLQQPTPGTTCHSRVSKCLTSESLQRCDGGTKRVSYRCEVRHSWLEVSGILTVPKNLGRYKIAQ